MFRSNKPKITNFRVDYAKHADFCDVFRNDTKHLYLLAFLLTANHEESEQCFLSAVEEAFKEPAVFKEWVRSWIKRRLIENAIKIVSPALAGNGQRRELWSSGQREAPQGVLTPGGASETSRNSVVTKRRIFRFDNSHQVIHRGVQIRQPLNRCGYVERLA